MTALAGSVASMSETVRGHITPISLGMALACCMAAPGTPLVPSRSIPFPYLTPSRSHTVPLIVSQVAFELYSILATLQGGKSYLHIEEFTMLLGFLAVRKR